ncbi:MAG: hypothetical protein MJZ30_11410, partial [Paludibacteraceae bacterium]|nr:hypothetical protein [Paludibacteraceae bacterium]
TTEATEATTEATEATEATAFGAYRVGLNAEKKSLRYLRDNFRLALDNYLVNIHSVCKSINKLAARDEDIRDYISRAVASPVRGGSDITAYDLPHLVIRDDKDGKIFRPIVRVHVYTEKVYNKYMANVKVGKNSQFCGSVVVDGSLFIVLECVKKSETNIKFYCNVLDDVAKVWSKLGMSPTNNIGRLLSGFYGSHSVSVEFSNDCKGAEIGCFK